MRILSKTLHPRFVLASSVAAMLLAGSAAVHAGTNWTGAVDADWFTLGNWDNGVPNGDSAVVNTGTAVINASASANNLGIGNASGTNGTIFVTAGKFDAGDWSFAGQSGGTGTLNITNTATASPGTFTGLDIGTGTMSYHSGLTMFGFGAGSVGTLNINSNATMSGTGWAGDEGSTVGFSNQYTNGGAAPTWDFGNGGTGNLNIDNGVLGFVGVPLSFASNGGVSTIQMSNGTISGTQDIRIGAGTGTVIANPIVQATAPGSGTATLTMTGGAITSSTAVVFGRNGATATANISGGTISAGSNVYIGRNGGEATVAISGGSISTTGTLRVGDDLGGVGHLTISGTGDVANTGGNSLTVNGNSSVVINGGKYRTTGGGYLVVGNAATASASTSTVDINTGGTMESKGMLWLGNANNANGVINVHDGILNHSSDLTNGSVTLGNAVGSTGLINQSGGVVHVGTGPNGGNVANLVIQGAGQGTYNLSGGKLEVDTAIVKNGGTFTWTAGTITRSNAGAITFTGDLATGGLGSTFGLDNASGNVKTFAVSGQLSITSGITIDAQNFILPNVVGAGSFALGTVGSINGTFDLANTSVTGLTNPLGLAFTSEAIGEGSNPANSYWISENNGAVTLAYNVTSVPEPTTLITLLGGIGTLVGLRRFRRRSA